MTKLIRAEDKLARHHDLIKAQQATIENLKERVIRLETTVDLLLRAAEQWRLS